MNSERSTIPNPNTAERWALPQFESRRVFARDDSSGCEKRPVEPVRIVIVEDDYLVALAMEAALAAAGFEIAGVGTSAEEVIQLVASRRPALIVMDIRIGGTRDGIDTAIELFRTHGIRCIFASAHNTEAARTRAKPAEPLAWLPKPYTMAALVEVVRWAVSYLRTS